MINKQWWCIVDKPFHLIMDYFWLHSVKYVFCVLVTNADGCGLHQIETFSALLAFCPGNSPVTVEFPAQRPETRSFDVLSDLRLHNRLSKQSLGWWFETPSHSLWRHSNDFDIIGGYLRLVSRRYDFLRRGLYSQNYLAFCLKIPLYLEAASLVIRCCAANEALIYFQSARQSLHPNLTASRFHGIQSSVCLTNTIPRSTTGVRNLLQWPLLYYEVIIAYRYLCIMHRYVCANVTVFIP